jgi:hypothetical protein
VSDEKKVCQLSKVRSGSILNVVCVQNDTYMIIAIGTTRKSVIHTTAGAIRR